MIKHPYTLEMYIGGKGKEYFWRIKRKGRVVADGGESYPTRKKLERAVSGLIGGLFKAEAVKVKDIAFKDDE